MATNVDIVDTALSYVGKLKYVFGSDNIEGGTGDCSSYTEYVFKQNGYNIGADTSAQYTQGVPVNKDDLQPGDLVFFKGTYNSGKIDGVSHVGIYVGDSNFVDLGSKGCSVRSLNDSYWVRHYLDGRRVVGVTYSDLDYVGTVSEGSGTGSEGSGAASVGLHWWGDIVKVVLIVIVAAVGVGLLAGAVGVNLKGMMKNPVSTGE